MANVQLSDLPVASSVADADLLHIRQGGIDKQAAVSLLPFGSGGLVRQAWAAPYDYIGTAASGASEGSAVWRITRITVANDGTVSVGVADPATWTNRGSETYI